MSDSQLLSNGFIKPSTTYGEYNNISFAVRRALAKMQTATLVRIVACTNAGDTSPVGFVDVLPLVNQIDGNSKATPHVTVYNLPYLRLQGGASAIILDPQAGDIGIAVFASRDISIVKSTKDQANPGSFRSYDFSDGLYLGGMLNAQPEQYVQFNSQGITIVSQQTITLQAPNIALNGDVTIAQNLTASGEVEASGIKLSVHTHTSKPAGQPTSPPLP